MSVTAATLADGDYGYVQVGENEADIYYSTYTDGSVRVEISYSVTSAAVFDIAVVEPWEENPVTWELSNYTRYAPDGYSFPEPPKGGRVGQLSEAPLRAGVQLTRFSAPDDYPVSLGLGTQKLTGLKRAASLRTVR